MQLPLTIWTVDRQGGPGGGGLTPCVACFEPRVRTATLPRIARGWLGATAVTQAKGEGARERS